MPIMFPSSMKKRTAAKPFHFTETADGYHKLRQVLDRLAKKHPRLHLHIRIDAAGQYAENLLQWLHQLSFDTTTTTSAAAANQRRSRHPPHSPRPRHSGRRSHPALSRPKRRPPHSLTRRNANRGSMQLNSFVRRIRFGIGFVFRNCSPRPGRAATAPTGRSANRTRLGGPEDRHKTAHDRVSALRASSHSRSSEPVVDATGYGCVVPPVLAGYGTATFISPRPHAASM